MSYINRENNALKRKVKVNLSGRIDVFEGTLPGYTAAHAEGVCFEGFGLTAVFCVDLYQSYLGDIMNNPQWRVYETANPSNVLIDTDDGKNHFDLTLDIEVSAVSSAELIDIVFEQDNEGKYIWRGLKESGLPQTKYTLDYDLGHNWAGKVNGVSFTAVNNGAFTLTCGHNATNKPYPQGGTASDEGGDCHGSVNLIDGITFNTDTHYEYYIEKTQTIETEEVTSQAWLSSDVWKIEIQAVNPYRFSVLPKITSSITEFPGKYKYSLRDRHGLNINKLRFTDVNGNSWRGPNSQTYYYDGVQVITAEGEWPNCIKTVTPAFDSNGSWLPDDPMPSRIGGIECNNPETVNPYVITEERDNGDTYTVKPSRVMVYAPLGDEGNDPENNLKGELDFIEQPSFELDDFSEGWEAERGTWQNGTLTPDADAAFFRKGYERELYPAEEKNDPEEPDPEEESEQESGQESEPEQEPQEGEGEEEPEDKLKGLLLPHLPHHSILKLNGTNLDTTQEVRLIIEAKGHKYQFRPVKMTAAAYVYDLTRPMKIGGYMQDRTNTLYDLWEWERRTTVEKGVWYIDEAVQNGRFNGPIVYDTIKFIGFKPGTPYSFTSITTEIAEGERALFFAGFEFEKVRECGTWKTEKGETEMTISRNRYLTVMQGGRFLETFCNQKNETDMGIVTWNFPTITRLTRDTGGNRLLFPRDDAEIINITCDDPVGGNEPPVSDLVTSQAYIGWLDAELDNSVLKIRPAADYIQIKWGHTLLYEGDLELEGFTDLGAVYQGFVNAETDAFRIDGVDITNNTVQFVSGAVSLVESLEYRVGQERKFYEEDPDIIPGFVFRYAVRYSPDGIHGYIWRNENGLILRNENAIILRGDYDLE